MSGLIGNRFQTRPEVTLLSRRSVQVVMSCGMGSGQLVLFGSSGHVAYRMCSLHPSGAGTRNNSKKREYVGTHLPQIEYRVIAFASRDEARDFERRELLSRRDQYIFKT